MKRFLFTIVLSTFGTFNLCAQSQVVYTPTWTAQAQFAGFYVADTMIFLYTDGLNEAENIDHQQFTEARMFNVAEQVLNEDNVSAQTIVERMSGAVNGFDGDAEQSDDLTMLAIKRKFPVAD
jgi:hypothetical protein